MDNPEPPFGDRATQIEMYLDALRQRLSENDVERVLRAVRETTALLSRGVDGTLDLDLSEELQREHAMLTTVLISGEMDMHRVQVPTDDGEPAWIVVSGDTVHAPDRMAEITDFVRKLRREQKTLRAEVDGIARASDVPASREHGGRR